MSKEQRQEENVTTKSLLLLEHILRNRIKQKKREIDISQNCNHNPTYIENLWTEVRMIQWVLGEILTILNNKNKNNKSTK